MGQLSDDQSINQESILLNSLIKRRTTAIYHTQHSKIGYMAFFTLQLTPRPDRLVINRDMQMLTWDLVECYTGVYEQRMRDIHGIVIWQGPRTTLWYEHDLRILQLGNSRMLPY
jgi:hypothetical protein